MNVHTPTPGPVRVADLLPDRLAEAVDVLAEAFAGYPVCAHFFASRPTRIGELTRRMLHLACRLRLLVGWPIPTATSPDGAILGVACLSKPEEADEPSEIERETEEFLAAAGPASTERFAAYVDWKTSCRPAGPHYYLTAIGVVPAAQGRGVGRALMDHIHAIVEGDPGADGIALDTQTFRNVAYYQRFGYEVLSRAPLGDIETWMMHRPRR
jgi:GNAT superfamily N-acetyltransferase